MRKKWIWIVGIVLVLIILVFALAQCGKKAMGKAMQAQGGDQHHIVARGDIESRIEITGEVQPQNLISLKSKVSGKIVKFYADENDFVRMGQIIADIEPDYNQANTLFNTKAQLKRAKIRLDKAVKDLEDKGVLLEKGYISQETYDEASRELQNAQIEHEQATNQYEVIQDLDVPGKVTHVYATATGVVIERKVNEGEMVQSSLNSFGEGTVVMKIADLSKMIIKSNINEVDIAKFSLGQKAKISLDALAYEQFEGQVVKIAPMAIVENNAKVFPVEISINADGHKVKPGMTAAVSILGEDRKNVLVIPIRAVFTNDDDEDIVYLLPKEGKSKTDKAQAPTQTNGIPTRVKLGANDMQMVEVISGLKEGDKIMLNDPGQKSFFPMMM